MREDGNLSESIRDYLGAMGIGSLKMTFTEPDKNFEYCPWCSDPLNGNWVCTGCGKDWIKEATVDFVEIKPLTKLQTTISAMDREEFFNDDAPDKAEPVTDCHDKAVKNDSNKLRMELIPPDALEALARILTDGAIKYSSRNWELGMEWSRPYAALQRHLLAWWGGQDVDPESGHPHLWHVLTNAVFLVSYNERKIGEDDRP